VSVPPITDGLWFAVPLRSHGFGVGVVARSSADGVLLGYFFGPKRPYPPIANDLVDLEATDSIFVTKFGHLGIKGGSWPIVGEVPGWDRSKWPMPIFIRYEELTGRTFHVVYDENDPNRRIREQQVAPGVEEQGPKDASFGAGAVELRLTRLLDE